jgi:hypothetical protein
MGFETIMPPCLSTREMSSHYTAHIVCGIALGQILIALSAQ